MGETAAGWSRQPDGSARRDDGAPRRVRGRRSVTDSTVGSAGPQDVGSTVETAAPVPGLPHAQMLNSAEVGLNYSEFNRFGPHRLNSVIQGLNSTFVYLILYL